MEKENFVSISKANQNFSDVARKCREQGEVYILKNNKVEFLLKSLSGNNQEMELSENDIIDIASRRVLKKYHKAFEELAK